MKSIHDMLVFESEEGVTLARKERHIEMTAPGFLHELNGHTATQWCAWLPH
jgi:hypothetical protein